MNHVRNLVSFIKAVRSKRYKIVRYFLKLEKILIVKIRTIRHHLYSNRIL